MHKLDLILTFRFEYTICTAFEHEVVIGWWRNDMAFEREQNVVKQRAWLDFEICSHISMLY